MFGTVVKQLLARLRLLRNPVSFARSLGVTVGDGCWFLSAQPGTFGSEPYLVRLGDRVTVAGGVRFVTHDGGITVFRREDPTIDVMAPIRVGNDVFIGLNAIVMPGVTIGDNSVVGAGSVVTRDVPPHSVVAGNPARVVCTIEEYREKSFRRSLGTGGLAPESKRERLTALLAEPRSFVER